jgi:hypothetical protein
LWGVVGYALWNLGRHRAGARWLADWEVRENVQPWMLINLVLCLRHLGRDADAARVSRHALGLPADPWTSHHQLWLALDELCQARAGEASARLDTIDPEKFRPTHRYLHGLALTLRDVLRAEPAARRRTALAARRKLVELNRRTVIPAADHRAVLRAYRRAIGQIVRPLGCVLGSIVWIELMLKKPQSK